MAQITITGHLFDSTGTAQVGAPVWFELTNLNGNVPYVSGTNVIVTTKVIVTTTAGGAYTAQIQGNDTITPANTFYRVTFNNNEVNYYSFTGSGPINLDSFPPLTTFPVPIGGLPTNILTGNNIFTGSNTFTGPFLATSQASIRQIATRSFISKSSSSVNKAFMARNWHVARLAPGEVLFSVQVVVGNFYDPNNGEVGTGGTKTATASIEYPAGTFNQATFSGSSSVQIASGGIAVSDPIVLQVPIPNGALFWERYYYTNPTAGDYHNIFDPNADACTFGPLNDGVTDQTMGGTVSNTVPGTGTGLLAIIGLTRQASVLIIGDSRSLGIKDGPGNFSGGIVSNSYIGTIAPSLAAVLPFINASVSGELASTFVSGSHTQKVALGQYCTHIIDALGINDITSGASPATIFSNQQTIAGYFPNKPFYLTTLSPVTTTTDNWTTLANQTVNANNANYQTYNEQVRSSKQLSYVADIFDIASVTEAGMGSGLWIVSPTANIANYATADGTHENEVGNRLIKNSGAINPGKIHF